MSAIAPAGLGEAAVFAATVIACLIAVRMAWVLLYNQLVDRTGGQHDDAGPPSLREGVLIGWCGMRGLVTLATAIALPAEFPQRDLIVLTALALVLATLVVQGLTLTPLVRALKLDAEDGLAAELADARAEMAGVALRTLKLLAADAIADHWRFALAGARTPAARGLGLQATQRQRERLDDLRAAQRVGPDAFAILHEELDFAQVALTSACDRMI